jgi:hypothetical protein
VNSDGTTQTDVHPYNPSTDPPPATSETHVTNAAPQESNSRPISGITQDTNQRPISGITQETQAHVPTDNDWIQRPRQNSTSGGRPIPPRSELRPNSSLSPTSPTFAAGQQGSINQGPSELAERQYSSNTIPNPYPHNSGPQTQDYSYRTPSQYSNQSAQSSQGTQGTQYANSQQSYTNTAQPAHHTSKREHIASVAKGLHGAGEALRGTLNSAVAGRMGDDLDAMNARMVREQGLREVRESGVHVPGTDRLAGTDRVGGRDRFDMTNGAGKLRKRSLSRGLREQGGLERVDEAYYER